jgi:uncharacterized integral membrane protein (TIGR00698 family)
MSQSKNDYSWAEYLDYMEGNDSDVLNLRHAKPAQTSVLGEHPAWGLILAMVVTLIAIWLADLKVWPFTLKSASGRDMHPIEPVMIAIILGMIIGNLWKLPKGLMPGLKFSVKKVLPFAIILLGVRLNFHDIVKLGLTGLGLSCLETVVALGLLYFLARWMKLPRKLGTLLGIGTAICGGTAIVAVAPAIEAEEKDVAFSVATVTLLGLLGMFLLPILGHMLDLSSRQFGIWAGLAIHQTPQVIAAGYSYWPTNTEYSTEAGDTATIAKLARVVFILGFMHAKNKAKSDGGSGRKINYIRLFPMFVLGFIGMALLKTLGLIPEITLHDAAFFNPGVHTWKLSDLAEQTSKFCIAVSMAGVGLETKFSAMRQTGLKPFMASLIAVVVVAILVLALIKLLGI